MTLKSSTAWIKALCIGTAVVVLGACAATDNTADNPILRKFQWFSYLEGGDFKDTCAPGQPARYRMVYNAVYTQQVRVYDLMPSTQRLDARVILPMDVRNFYIEGVSDLLNPWRGTTASRELTSDESDMLVHALSADGAFGPPAVGTELPSKGYFWTIASCHDGTYHFTAVTWPSPAWDTTRFDDALFALDPVDIAVMDPKKTDTRRTVRRGTQGYSVDNEFIIKVGENGLADFATLF